MNEIEQSMEEAGLDMLAVCYEAKVNNQKEGKREGESAQVVIANM